MNDAASAITSRAFHVPLAARPRPRRRATEVARDHHETVPGRKYSMPILPGRGPSLDLAATAGPVRDPRIVTRPFMSVVAKQISTGATVRDTGFTGISTEAPDHPGDTVPRASTREPESAFTATLGPSAAVRLRRSAVVPRGSVSPDWQADAGRVVPTKMPSAAPPLRATTSGACASVTATAIAISANPQASAALGGVTGAAARGC
jgi:hypothetical protein